MNPSIWAELGTVIRRELDLDESAAPLKPETKASDVPGWDSVSHVVLILAIEKHFRVKFTASEIGRLQNVGDLGDLIEKKRAGAPGAGRNA